MLDFFNRKRREHLEIEQLSETKAALLLNRFIGFVFQSFNLIAYIAAGRWINRLDMDQARKTAMTGTEVEAILFNNRPAVGNQLMIDGIPISN